MDSLAVDYLFEIGKHFYDTDRFQDAFQEFEKVLILNPDHKEAIYYIRLISKKGSSALLEPAKIPPPPPQKNKEMIIEEVLLKTEKNFKASIKKPKGPQKAKAVSVVPYPAAISRQPSVAIEEPQPIPLPVEKPVEKYELAPLERKGDISLFIDGREVSTEKPILIKEGVVFVALKEIASKLYFSLLDLKGGNFKIISPEGISKEIKVSFIENEPMISEVQLRDYFTVETFFNAAQKSFNINRKYPVQFESYALEKTPEDIQRDKELQDIVKKATAIPEKPTEIPSSAMPSVQLKSNTSYTYIDYHISPCYHSLASTLTGRFYDFDLRYESVWKDINGVFDHDYTYLNFLKPGLFIGLFDQSIDLYPLRGQQYQSFNGLKVINDFSNLNKITFVGGKTDVTVSATAGTVKYLGNIYGLKEEFRPLDWLGLKGGLFYWENKVDIPSLSGTTSFPRNNLLSFSDISLKLPYDLSLSSALAHAYYEPDDSPGSIVEDLDWRVGTELNKKRYKLGFAYEFVGNQYVSLSNPAFYQDYSGWNLYGNYKVTENWLLYTSTTRYHDNVEDDPNRIRTNNTIFSLSSYHHLTPMQSITLSFNRFLSDPEGPNSGPSNKSNLYRIDYFLPFFFDTRTLLDYQYYRNDSSDSSEYYTHTLGGSLFKSFGKGSSWYLRQQFTESFYKTSEDNLDSSTTFNINYLLNPLFSIYFNSSYSRNKTNQQRAVDTASGSSGFTYRIFPDTTLNGEYSINSYDLKTEKNRWPRNWSILVYVSQGFNLSSGLKFGVIEGRVFKDLNGNGKFDYNDSGVQDVILRLQDMREVTTNSRGYFKFSYVAPGIQNIYLDLASLPAEWIAQEHEKEVDVKPRRNTKVSFPLTKTFTIKGKVFVDENADLIFQESEEPLEDIAILLSPGEQIRRTNQEGNFKFDYLLPGTYKVRINEADLPTGYELTSKREIDLHLLEGAEVKDINFSVCIRLVPTKTK